MYYIDPHNNLCYCSDSDYKTFGKTDNTTIIKLEMDRHIQLWEDRIQLIESGQVVNSNAYRPQPYFGQGMDKARRIKFCQSMIERLKKRKEIS